MHQLPPLSDELLRKLEVPGPRYTSYPTVPEWSDQFGAVDHAAALTATGAHPERPLSLYVHIPFCQELCTYCGCNVVVSRDATRADRYLGNVAREVALVAARVGKGRKLSRLHLGGGTPTFLNEAQLLRLWTSITDYFTPERNAEIALEIDPVVTRREQLALLRGLGFRRLSMGVQDFDPRVQEAVHRIQSVEQTRGMLDYARELGFESVNFDLIYGLPLQTPESWRRTLEQVAELRPDRVAAFSFAYVPEARPNQRKLNVVDIPRGANKLELVRVIHDTLGRAGYDPIGMDHFALSTDELSIAQKAGRLWRDFQGYTVQRDSETIALGITAISALETAYAQNVRSLMDYEHALDEGVLPTAKGMKLSADDRLRRAVITDLMCNFELDLATTVDDAANYFADELVALRPLVADGLLTLDGTRISLLPLGRLFVRNVAMVFDAYLDKHAAADRPVFSSTL